MPSTRSPLSKLMDALVPARRKVLKIQADFDQLAAFSETIPYDYCGWDKSGSVVRSAGMAGLFGLQKISSVKDIVSAVTPKDGEAVDKAYRQLTETGDEFSQIVFVPATKRHIRLTGKRNGNATPSFLMLWAADITDIVSAAQHGAAAAADLSRKESELRAAMNTLPFPVWTRDQNLNISWCNKFYARVIDDSMASVIADQKELPMTGANKHELSQRVLAQRAMAIGEAQSMRGHIIVDGQRKLVEIVEIPLPAEKRGIGVALDVTKEEEWAMSYERLSVSQRESMEQLRTAIAMFDADTRLEFYNASYEQLTGMTGNFLDSKPKMVEIVDKLRELRKLPELVDYKQYKQQWLNRFSSLLEPHEEMQYLPDGSVIRMIVVPRPMGGLIVTQEDVTSRLQLETSYNTLIAVQQETMDNLSEGIAVFGEDGRLRLSNQAFARMWKIPGEELTGATHVSHILDRASRFFDEGDWPDARNTLLGNALEREMRRGRLRRNNGTILEYSVVPLPDGNMLNAYFDITDSVRVEQALLDKNAALEAAERLKTDFLANVSYQLRTPLNAILGFSEMLNQQYVGPLNDRQLEYTGSMIEAGQRLVSLINDILDLSTIDAGYMKIYPREMNLRYLLDQVAGLTEDWARKQKIEISVDAPRELVIEADERRIKQVLLNLVSNAINYSPNGGRIVLSATINSERVEFSVSDKGLGIPAADIERIFTPFEKIHDGKTKRRSGAGLGLALVKNIVQLHGGTVAIQSVEGEGTTVTCRLPLKVMTG